MTKDETKVLSRVAQIDDVCVLAGLLLRVLLSAEAVDKEKLRATLLSHATGPLPEYRDTWRTIMKYALPDDPLPRRVSALRRGRLPAKKRAT